ncbi:MAG TPA: FAD-binding protein [Mycobacterium sp.]|nr:FAD-binding protein [Mycobacterium sp.]
MNWDEEVDMVCTGSGAAALASAISVVDVGGEAFVAKSIGEDVSSDTHAPTSPSANRLHRWLGVDIPDSETNEYLAAVSADLGPLRRSARDVAVPIRVVHEPAPVESSLTVAPFVGSRLRDWAARCVASSYGYLYTRLSDWHSTTLHTSDGDVIEVAEIGSITPDPDNVGGSVLDWLTAQAHDRNIVVQPNSSLQRIVFEDGKAVGAVFATSEGTLAVRARHGVTVASGGPHVDGAVSYSLPAGDTALRVCLVGQHASRFGRLELLTSEPLTHCVATNCRPVNRQLHVNMHETYAHSQTWRCRKIQGYPPLGQ